MKSKVTLWNAPFHLVLDLAATWKTMRIGRWRTADTLAVLITFILILSVIHAGKLIYTIYTVTH